MKQIYYRSKQKFKQPKYFRNFIITERNGSKFKAFIEKNNRFDSISFFRSKQYFVCEIQKIAIGIRQAYTNLIVKIIEGKNIKITQEIDVILLVFGKVPEKSFEYGKSQNIFSVLGKDENIYQRNLWLNLKLSSSNEIKYSLSFINYHNLVPKIKHPIISNKKRKQEAQRKHLAALRNIKPSIDNTQPQDFRFLYTRPKSKMMKLERQVNIQNANNILVEKMISISTIHRPKQTFVKDSLNFSFNKKVERQIDLENQALVKRLRSVSSQYGQRNIGKFVQDYHRARSNLTKSRANTTIYDFEMPSKHLTGSKRAFSAKSRPFSAKV